MLNLPDPPPLLFHKNHPPFLLTRHRDGLSVWLFCIFLSSLTHLFPLSTFRFFFFTPPQSPWCYPFGSKTWQLSSYTVPIFNLISCHPILLILHLLSRCHTFYPLNPPPPPPPLTFTSSSSFTFPILTFFSNERPRANLTLHNLLIRDTNTVRPCDAKHTGAWQVRWPYAEN